MVMTKPDTIAKVKLQILNAKCVLAAVSQLVVKANKESAAQSKKTTTAPAPKNNNPTTALTHLEGCSIQVSEKSYII